MDITEIDNLLTAAQAELAKLDTERLTILGQTKTLKSQKESVDHVISETIFPKGRAPVSNQSQAQEKVSLFRSLFRGREDIYARRFESKQTGKSGYQPTCRNEWVNGVCGKPKVPCGSCNCRDLLPITDEVIKNHLQGIDPNEYTKRDFIIGVYPLLPDETCWFLAVDFDKATWVEDTATFLKTCCSLDVPAVLERSRSGNGGHIWIFFSEPIPASLARKLGSFLLTETMEYRPEIGLDSYDRFFPSQDTIPKGGFGNLIALPLQKKPREAGNSLFLDESYAPYPDQWAFLATIRRMDHSEIDTIVDDAGRRGKLIGVRSVVTDADDDEPWTMPPSRRENEMNISGPLPPQIEIVLVNQIYIAKEPLCSSLRNRLIRLAAFQNPEFYQAQAMRLPTYNKPRIISCCEDFPKHLGFPRGCLDDIVDLLQALKINVNLVDQRFVGHPIDTSFKGILRPEQQQAANAMLAHDSGVLSATTAFGKTVVALYMIAMRGVNTLILVHRRQLLDQWISRISSFLGIAADEIGQIGGGKRSPTGKIDVAIIQSLSKKDVVDDIVADYGHLVVDECHHLSARSFEIVARRCKAKYVTGLSATVTRKDGHHPIIFMNCGPVRYRVDDRTQTAARPFTHRVILRNTGFTLPDALAETKDISIHDLYMALISDQSRNELIVYDVLRVVSEGRSPVLLTERTSHLEFLAARLSSQIRNVMVFKGGMGKKQRQQLTEKLASIPDDEERIILATGRYLGEGFDDARLDTLFLTLPVSWRGTITQYAGRLHRSHDMKKEVLIYDYADLNVPVLAKMYQRRCRGYKAIGYEIGENTVQNAKTALV
jgi:superfamily II DNA or RNA helicase